MDSQELDKRRALLKRIKRGPQTGSARWTRLFMLLVTFGVLLISILDAFRGKENFKLLVDAIVMIFIFATSVMGSGMMDLNDRFDALIELIGEENLLKKAQEKAE